jgi:hypothetical protein
MFALLVVYVLIPFIWPAGCSTKRPSRVTREVSWRACLNLKPIRSDLTLSLSRDEMGLGKTVQMIATMVMNQPDEDANRRSTLIVVPSALLAQVRDMLSCRSLA